LPKILALGLQIRGLSKLSAIFSLDIECHSDTISSHDKKRLYLESLEQYVMYLHDQLRIVGTEPVTLERVSTYRGLSSRSIRVNVHMVVRNLTTAADIYLAFPQTLLVHMESEVRKMHTQTITDEQEVKHYSIISNITATYLTFHLHFQFLDLRDEYLEFEAAFLSSQENNHTSPGNPGPYST
jgi:hypothetical protein